MGRLRAGETCASPPDSRPGSFPFDRCLDRLIAAIIVLLAIDLLLVRGRGGAMPAGQAAIARAPWVAVLLGCFGVLLAYGDTADANAFLAGYLMEKSPSPAADVWDRRRAHPPRALHRRRRRPARRRRMGSLLFVAPLGWTAWRMWRHRHDHDESGELVDKLRRRLPIADDGDGHRLVTREGGRRPHETQRPPN